MRPGWSRSTPRHRAATQAAFDGPRMHRTASAAHGTDTETQAPHASRRKAARCIDPAHVARHPSGLLAFERGTVGDGRIGLELHVNDEWFVSGCTEFEAMSSAVDVQAGKGLIEIFDCADVITVHVDLG